jgi:hypothetical protein
MDQEAASLIFAMSLFLACCCSWKWAGGMVIRMTFPGSAEKVHKYRELVGPHTLGFAVVTVTTVFVVLNIEFPRQGLFRADADGQVLIDLREG